MSNERERIVPASRNETNDVNQAGGASQGENGPGYGEQGQPAYNPASTPRRSSGFVLNQPTIIALLYISNLIFGITALVGVVLAYVWRSGAEDWEISHLTFQIRTFWFGLLGTVIGFMTLFFLIGFFILIFMAVWAIVRSAISLDLAQKRQPLSDPESLGFTGGGA